MLTYYIIYIFFFSQLYPASCYVNFFLSPTDAKENCCKKGVSKFTLKQLQHVSVWSPSSGSLVYELVTLASSYSTLLDDGDRLDSTWIWVRGLSAPMHLGLDLNGPFVPHIESWEPRDLTTVPDGPQAWTPNILRLQEKGAQVRMSELGQSLALTKNVSRGFLSHPALPAQGTVKQP